MELSKIKPSAPPQRGNAPWRDVAALLRAAPGVWHEIPDAPKTSTTDMRRGTPSAFEPAGAFDATRANGSLFMRYVGEPSVAWRDPVTLAYAVNPETGEPFTFDELPRDPDFTGVAQSD